MEVLLQCFSHQLLLIILFMEYRRKVRATIADVPNSQMQNCLKKVLELLYLLLYNYIKKIMYSYIIIAAGYRFYRETTRSAEK